VGLKTWDELTSQYPTQALVARAAGMSIPMVASMLYRRMGRKTAYEMAAAIRDPVPVSGLVRGHQMRATRAGG
jgi:hypothetical protein